MWLSVLSESIWLVTLLMPNVLSKLEKLYKTATADSF